MNISKMGLPMLVALLLISTSPIAAAKKSKPETSESEACVCDGKLTTLTLQYTGSTATSLTVMQRNGDMVHDDNFLFPNEVFAFSGTDQRGSKLSNTTFGPVIYLYTGNGTETSIHTSCSIEVNVGDVFGDFKVVAGTSRNNGAICGALPPPPPPID